MKLVIALLLSLCCYANSSSATTLVGMIQYHEVEGRIGVRVNHHGRVHKVHAQSPAALAGIQQGDVITSVDGRRSGFVGKIHGTPGTTVSLTIKRAGEEFAVQVQRVDFREFHVANAAPLLVQN